MINGKNSCINEQFLSNLLEKSSSFRQLLKNFWSSSDSGATCGLRLAIINSKVRDIMGTIRKFKWRSGTGHVTIWTDNRRKTRVMFWTPRGHKEPRKIKDEMDNFIHERNFSTCTCPAKRGQVSLNRKCLRPMTLIQRLPETELNWTELNWDSKALSYESVTEGVAGKQFHEKYTRRFDSCNTHSDQGWPEVKNR